MYDIKIIHAILYLSKPIGRTVQKVNPNITNVPLDGKGAMLITREALLSSGQEVHEKVLYLPPNFVLNLKLHLKMNCY